MGDPDMDTAGEDRTVTAGTPADGTGGDGRSTLRRLLTPRWITFTFVMLSAVTGCLLLARWQYERFESVSGTWQNLGYTLQWPFFAAFAVYVWWRLLRDAGVRPAETAGASADVIEEADRTEQAERVPAARRAMDAKIADLSGSDAGATTTQGSVARAGAHDEPGDADDEDAELAAYNEYLAALNRRSR